MRLHSLEITAFGAFGGTERIDFDALSADGLFLLHGPTGSGKTTILDAVSFALYGTVPGSRGHKRLKSDHSDAQVTPTVVLEATIGGRTLRITRSPGFERPRKRGTGTVTQQPRGVLEWLDAQGGDNLSRLPDIGEAVVRLLGLKSSQFEQVVMLPQGQFAKFLNSNTKDRGILLERLFDTSRFASIEQWFVDREKAESARIATARNRVLGTVATVAEAAGCSDYEPDVDGDEQEWADLQVDRCHAAVEARYPEFELLRSRAEQARAEARRAAELAKDRARAVQARDRLAAHAAEAELRAQLTAEAADADRAEKVAWAITHRDESVTAVEQALRRLRGHIDAADTDPEGAAVVQQARTGDADDAIAADRLRDAIDRWHTEARALAAAAEQERARDEAVTERDEVTAALARADAESAELTEKIAAAPALIDSARARLEPLDRLAATAAGADEAVTAARAVADAATAVEAAQQRLAAAKERAETAAQAHLSARAHSLDLRERRLAGMAAELAAELVSGEPCGVCGATEHPQPARTAASPVTEEDESAAQNALDAAAAEAEVARAAAHDLGTEVALLVEKAAGLDAAEADRRHTEAQEAAAAARSAAEELPKAKAELEDLIGAQTSAQTRSTSLRTERETATKRIDDLDARIRTLDERITAAAGEDGTVAARAQRVERLRDTVTALLEQLTRVADARDRATKAETGLAAALADNGFDTAAQALAARRDPTRRSRIDEQLAEAARVEAAARAVLAEPAVTAAGDIDEPVDTAGTEQAAAEAEEALVVGRRAYDEARHRFERVSARRAELSAELTDLAPVLARYRELYELTQVVRGLGGNARQISLRSYVLAARLEEVVAVASQRLRIMSGGRYEFIHSDGRIGGERSGGLALDVLDGDTGRVRPTETLSGGETFMASLSLALGLADVVSAEAGGIRIDTLFIDEGFGTLDSETLDQVMGVLDELRAGGRAVGIVSHVAEMRHRIPSRLFVDKTGAGSQVQVTLP